MARSSDLIGSNGLDDGSAFVHKGCRVVFAQAMPVYGAGDAADWNGAACKQQLLQLEVVKVP